ncbi:MAG: hypothetical protein ACRDKE_04155, partial [Solirubrobacterales bacterium]
MSGLLITLPLPRALTRSALLLGVALAAFACSASAAYAATEISVVTPVAASTVTSSPPLLDWTLTDAPAVSDVQCRADGHAWMSCSDNSRFFEVRLNGAHTIDLRVRDKTVSEPYPIAATASVSFTLNDTTAPTLGFTDISSGETLTDSNIEPSFTSDENAAEFNCVLDGWINSCDPSYIDLNPIANGPHTLKINAADYAGNASSLTIPFTMADVTSPTVDITSPDNVSPYTDSSLPPTIDFTVAGESDVACGYDDQPLYNCSPYGKPPLGNGVHTARVVVSDPAGNSATDTVTFTINDVTAPTFTVTKPTESFTYLTYAQALLSPSDESARHYYSFDDSGMKLMQGGSTVIANLPNAPNGAHSVKFTAIDGAGNRHTEVRNFTYADATVPTVDTINPSNGSTINFNQGAVGYTSNDSDYGSCKFDVGPPFPCQSSSVYQLYGLAPGPHTFTVVVYDQVGNSSAPVTTSFTLVETTSGSMTLVSPTNQTYTSQPVLRLPPGISVGLCRLNGGVQSYCYNGMPLATANGSWSLEVIGLDPPNAYTATVSFTTADVTPPELVVTYPEDGGTVENTREFAPFVYTTDYNAEGSSVSSDVVCSLDGGAETHCGDLANLGSPLESGGHTLLVTARDWADNAATELLNFTVTDSTGPTIKIISPLPAATVGSGGPQLVFWSSEDDDVDYKCHVDSRPATNCNPGDSWSPVSLGIGSTTPLGNGAHTLTVVGTDGSGNATTESVSVTLSDLTAPTLTIAENPGDTRSNLPSINWTASEPIVSVRCWIGIEPVTYVPETGCARDTDRSGKYAASAPVTGTWTIEATDNAGNAATASVAITVNDTTAPVVTVENFVPRVNGGNVYDDSPGGVQFSVDDPVAAYACSINGGAESPCSPPVWNFSPLPSGAYTLHIKGTDGSGNSATLSTPFTVTDLTPPALSITVGGAPPVNGMTLPAAFSAEATTEAGSTLSLAQDGGGFAPFAGTSAHFSYTSGGTHTASVRSTDLSGNSTTRSFTLNV